MSKQKILFVCLGNICRSPAAEAVMQKLIDDQGLNLEVDSAGTSGYHAGEKADERMIEHALKRGIDVTSRSRQFIAEDFRKFDYIIVMDDSNYRNVALLDPNGEYMHKVSKMTDYCTNSFGDYDHVPDPYYGAKDGFELVLDLLENSCFNFTQHLQKSV
jgi:protein-tyrosine phosphatase